MLAARGCCTSATARSPARSSRPATERVNVASGLFFGLALWGVAVAVYAPLVGLGFVASHEPALAALLLPAHLLYGATIGALAPRGEIVQPIEDRWPLDLGDA